jgi:hypothetical protein
MYNEIEQIMVKYLDKILTFKGLICTYIILIFFSLGLYWVSSVYPNTLNRLNKPFVIYDDYYSSDRVLDSANNSNQLGKKSELPEQKKESVLEEEVVTKGDIVIAEQDNSTIEQHEKNALHDQGVSTIILANDFPEPKKNNVTNNHEAQVADNLYKQADPAVSLNEETAETVQAESSGNIFNKNTLSGKSKENRKNASRKYYTIQTGSYIEVVNARYEIKSINHFLIDKMLDNLRIDKIGKYYSVRLGKFEDRSAAEKFLQSNKYHLRDAIILEAYVRDR